jgi:hypothetical protein
MFLSPNLAKTSYGCINTWVVSKVTKLEKEGKKFSAQAACGWWLENYRDHTLYKNFGGLGCKFFPSVASTADAFLSRLLQMRTVPSWVKWFQFEDFGGLGCKFFPFCCQYCWCAFVQMSTNENYAKSGPVKKV